MKISGPPWRVVSPGTAPSLETRIGPVTRAADSVGWISLQEAWDTVIAVMLTRAYVGPHIVKCLWQKRVRWTFVRVFGVPRAGWSLDQEARALWDHSPHKVLVDYEQSSAHKPAIFPSGGKGYITVIGIRVAREDIETVLAADYPDFAAPSSPLFDGPPQPAAETVIEPAAAMLNLPDIDVSAPSAVRGTLTVTQANQTLAAAGTVTVEPPLAADSLELFVYRDMKAHRSELGDRGYTRKLHERALIVHPLGPGEEQDEEEARLKTIRNYVSRYRHELAPDTVQRRHRKASKPTPESLQKLPKNFSRNFPKLPKPPGKS